jgi:hypothetical protein
MGCLLTLASTIALSLVDDHAGAMRGTGGGTRGLRPVHGSGGWSDPHPSYCSDADELLEAVVAAGFGGAEGAIRVHPGAMDAAGDELARRLALLPPAADFGPVALPDLDAGTTSDVERAVGVEGDSVGGLTYSCRLMNVPSVVKTCQRWFSQSIVRRSAHAW